MVLTPEPHSAAADRLDDALFNLLRRSYFLAEKEARGLEVYRDSTAMLGELCIERWVWKTIFPVETRLVLAFLAETKLPVKYRAPIVRDSLFTHSMYQTWMPIIEGLKPRQFATLCTVSGAEHVAAARAAGRGILIVQIRTIFSDVLQTWFRQQGLATRHYGSWNIALGDSDAVSKSGDSAGEFLEARESLRQGGAVLLFGDDAKVRSGIEVAFWNRRRTFSAAFGRLALETKASVLTAAVRLATDGRVCIEIGPALDEGSSAAPGTALKNLVLQYVARTSRFWRLHPASLSWTDMRSHLDLPQPAQAAPDHPDSKPAESEAPIGVSRPGAC